MSEEVPDREELDPADIDYLKNYLDEKQTIERDIKATSALSRELWETLQQSGSVSKMVADLGGVEEVEKVYGSRWREGLEEEIIKQSESSFKKGEK